MPQLLTHSIIVLDDLPRTGGNQLTCFTSMLIQHANLLPGIIPRLKEQSALE